MKVNKKEFEKYTFFTLFVLSFINHINIVYRAKDQLLVSI